MRATQPRRRVAASFWSEKSRPGRNAISCRRALLRSCWKRSIRKYQNRAIETAQVIEELIALAKDMCAANARARNSAVRG